MVSTYKQAKKLLLYSFFFILSTNVFAGNLGEVAYRIGDDGRMYISYDIRDNSLVYLWVSFDGGSTYVREWDYFSGDGGGVTAGKYKLMVVDKAILRGQTWDDVIIRLGTYSLVSNEIRKNIFHPTVRIYSGCPKLIFSYTNGGWAVYNESGNMVQPHSIVIPPVTFISGRGIAKRSNGEWIILNSSGYVEATLKYEYVDPVFLRYVIVGNGEGKMGLVSLNGNELLPTEYDAIYQDFNGGDNVVVEKNGKYQIVNGQYRKPVHEGWLDHVDLAVVDGEGTWFYGYKHDVTRVKVGDKYGYMDPNGQWYIRPMYSEASIPDSDGNAIVVFKGQQQTIRIGL
ncbi:MAG: WG repeat-containing protein [Bacteroidales bacterium]|nr:WG repeat-containing protein [Bacteroidales bacterium]